MISLNSFMFGAALIMLAVSVVIGLLAVWVPDFWRNDAGPKLMWNSLVLFAGTVAGAAITKWLM